MTAVPWWADPDPWAMTPAEQEAAEQRHREWQARVAEIPTEPPKLKEA